MAKGMETRCDVEQSGGIITIGRGLERQTQLDPGSLEQAILRVVHEGAEGGFLVPPAEIEGCLQVMADLPFYVLGQAGGEHSESLHYRATKRVAKAAQARR